jgi:hypothetical protein
MSRGEALDILGLSRYRFEALVDVGRLSMVLMEGWRTALYRRDEVESLREEMAVKGAVTKSRRKRQKR